jgi:hypothetical protein
LLAPALVITGTPFLLHTLIINFRPMEVLYLLTSFINDIFIKGLFISILSIMIAGKVLKTDTRNAFAIVKWLILVYAVLNTGYYFFAIFSPDKMVSFWERATDVYSYAYDLMIVSNTLLPLLLFLKKPGRNKYVLLALSFLMNIGWMFELFVIYRTDFHRDNGVRDLSFNVWWYILLSGTFIGSVIYAIGGAVQRKMLKAGAREAH